MCIRDREGEGHVLRLSQKEFWLIGHDVDRADLNHKALAMGSCYPLFCQDSHCWFMLTGDHKSDVMAKLCGVDLRNSAFPEGSIAQTSIARLNGLVIHHCVGKMQVYSILSDSASAQYLWEAIDDALSEFSP